MTDEELIELAVKKTGHVRYRELAKAKPQQWLPFLRHLIDPASSTELEPLGLMHKFAIHCPARKRPDSGCNCFSCSFGLGSRGKVGIVDCVRCQRGRLLALPRYK